MAFRLVIDSGLVRCAGIIGLEMVGLVGFVGGIGSRFLQ